MNPSLRSQRDDRGVVALEVVLVMPILLMLIIGTVVLGNFLNLKTQTSGLARDGARDAALRQTPRAGAVIVAGGCDASSDPLTDTVTVLGGVAVWRELRAVHPARLIRRSVESGAVFCGTASLLGISVDKTRPVPREVARSKVMSRSSSTAASPPESNRLPSGEKAMP